MRGVRLAQMGNDDMSRTAILITSHDAHIRHMREATLSALLSTEFVAVAHEVNRILPSREFIDECPIFVCGGKALGKQYGELRNYRRGLAMIHAMWRNDVDFVLKVPGDGIVGNPQGLRQLPALLGKADVLSPQWNGHVSSMVQFGRLSTLRRLWDNVGEIEVQVERELHKAMKQLGLVAKVMPITRADRGIWREVLGFWRIGGNYPK